MHNKCENEERKQEPCKVRKHELKPPYEKKDSRESNDDFGPGQKHHGITLTAVLGFEFPFMSKAGIFKPTAISRRQPLARSFRLILEQNLQGKLNLPRSSDDRGNSAGVRIPVSAAIERAQGGGGIVEISVVKDKKKFRAELKSGLLGNFRILRQIEVQSGIAG